MIQHILNDIVYQVDWALCFQIVSALLLLWIVSRALGFSPIHVALELIREIGRVITNPAITRKSIDAALTFSMILFVLIVLLSFAMHELGEYLILLRTGVKREEQSASLVVFLIFSVGIVGILSLKYTDRDG